MRRGLSERGIHSMMPAVQLSMLGPNTFDKMTSKTKSTKAQSLPERFFEAATDCDQAISDVFMVFMFMISRGKVIDKYRYQTVSKLLFKLQFC